MLTTNNPKLSQGDASILRLIQVVLADLRLKVKRVLPDTAECKDLFDQWDGAAKLVRKYPSDQRAIDFCNALYGQLIDAMKKEGVKTL